MPLFLGGTLAAAALAVMAILRWGDTRIGRHAPIGTSTVMDRFDRTDLQRADLIGEWRASVDDCDNYVSAGAR
jgi:hypothetical protein